MRQAEETGMQNAHERFGVLELTRRVKDTINEVCVRMDRLILEPSRDSRATAHLISVIGGDAEIGAVWAAVIEDAVLRLRMPSGGAIAATLGPDAKCFRGSVAVPTRKRPLRHLVALSNEMAKTRPGADREGARSVLCNRDPLFVLNRVARRFGLPVVPDWAPWFMEQLKHRKAIRSLVGLGCAPVVVQGTKQSFLDWISEGLKQGVIRIPEETGSISWILSRSSFEPSASAEH
jgi:hypothetical protein